MVLLYFINIAALIVFAIYIFSLGIRINADAEEIKKQHREFMYQQNKSNLNNKLLLAEIEASKEDIINNINPEIKKIVEKEVQKLAWTPLTIKKY